MYAIIDAAIQRSRTTLLILAMVVIAGIASDKAILVESEPHIEVPFFVVTIPHEGISPEDSERLLVMPMETEMRSIEGIKELTSYASEGAATLLVEFDADYNLDQASIDVRDAVDRAKAEIPSTAEEPIVQEQNTHDFPIIQINLLGDNVPERVLYNTAVQLRDDIEAIPEVLSAELNGQREEVLEALIDPAALESYQISNEQLLMNIVNNNRLIPAGALDTGEGRFAVKVPSVIEQAQDIFDIPVKADGDTVVTLRDVAQIRPKFKDRVSYARVNGKPAISLNISKRTNANIIDTVAKVRAVVEEARPQIPSSVEILYTQDQAPFAQEQVTELQGNIITALALVMIVVVASMGLRSGFIVALSVPVSFLVALTTIYLIGYTYNFMVMFGLLLGLGLVVDGAIVVTEYADRKLVEGFDRQAAYTLAAKRMFWPVVTSTGATLAAFLPLMFWPGISGKFMRYLPVTVFASLAGSLFYALIICPCLGALFGKAGVEDRKSTESLRELEEGDPTKLRTLLGLVCAGCAGAVRNAPITVLLMVATLIGSFMLYGAYGKGMVFFNEGETQFASIVIKSRGNLAADQMNPRQRSRSAHPRRARHQESQQLDDDVGRYAARDRSHRTDVRRDGRRERAGRHSPRSSKRYAPDGVVGRRVRSRCRRWSKGHASASRSSSSSARAIASCWNLPWPACAGTWIRRWKDCATSTTRALCPESNGRWRSIAPKQPCSGPTCRRSGWRCSSSQTA